MKKWKWNLRTSKVFVLWAKFRYQRNQQFKRISKIYFITTWNLNLGKYGRFSNQTRRFSILFRVHQNPSFQEVTYKTWICISLQIFYLQYCHHFNEMMGKVSTGMNEGGALTMAITFQRRQFANSFIFVMIIARCISGYSLYVITGEGRKE